MNHLWLILGGALLAVSASANFAPASPNGSQRDNPFAPVPPPGAYNPWQVKPERKTPNAVKVFRVSHVGSDNAQLLQVFAAVKTMEETLPPKQGINLHVIQRSSPTEFLVCKLQTYESISTSSLTSVGGGGGVGGSSYSIPDYSQTFWLRTESPKNAADGETIRNIAVIETPEVKTYTATLGNKRSVRVLVENPSRKAGRNFTHEEFVMRLRNREEWTLKNFEVEDCRICFGDGKLGVLQGNAPCPECANTQDVGKAFVDWIIKW